MPYSIATDDRYFYCGVSVTHKLVGERIIRRFARPTGKEAAYPGPAFITVPLARRKAHRQRQGRGLVAAAPRPRPGGRGRLLLVADPMNNRVLSYNKATVRRACRSRSNIPGPSPATVRTASSSASTTTRSVFSTGKEMPARCSSPMSLRLPAWPWPGSSLVRGRRGAGQVEIYQLAGNGASLVKSLGQKAQPGDRAADRFYQLLGVAVDGQGNCFTIQNENGLGSRLAKWKPDQTLAWEHWATEFQSLGNYGQNDPDEFYSTTLHRYKLLDRKRGTYEYQNLAIAGNARPSPTPTACFACSVSATTTSCTSPTATA